MKKHRNQDDRRQVSRRAEDQIIGEYSVTGVRFQGPLPPPGVLSAYNDVIPNGAERIFAMAERNQGHRHQLEARVVDGNVKAQSRGQWFMFIISIVAILAGVYLISVDKDTTGLAVIIADLVGLVGLFIYADRSKKRELRNKAGDLVKPLGGP